MSKVLVPNPLLVFNYTYTLVISFGSMVLNIIFIWILKFIYLDHFPELESKYPPLHSTFSFAYANNIWNLTCSNMTPWFTLAPRHTNTLHLEPSPSNLMAAFYLSREIAELFLTLLIFSYQNFWIFGKAS